MYEFSNQISLRLLICFCALLSFSSSAFASDNKQPGEEASPVAPTDTNVVVFGKFRLLKNGYETKLGEGLFGNIARLRFYRAETQEEMSTRVGKDGEFSIELLPGDYYLMSIAFKHRGETIEPETNFMFNVSADHQANYIGTITLESTFSSGYYGMKGSFDRFIVSDDCAAECASQLASLGLEDAATTTSLPVWQRQVAFSK